MQNSKGDLQYIKDVNKRLVLGIIERQYSASRAEIARTTKLSPTTVSTIIGELTDEGLVEEIGSGLSSRGRKPVMYQINHQARYIISADLGSNLLTVIVTDLKLNIVSEMQTNIMDLTGQELVRSLYRSINELINKTGIDRSKIIGVGVASPGLVDNRNGTVIKALNVKWEAMPLRGILEHQLGLPVLVENMNHAAAFGEYEKGLNREVRRFLYLNIGIGVGAGFIINDRLIQGLGVGAGEIGHMVMDRYGEECTCNSRGCLETLVSAKAIISQARKLVKHNSDSLILKLAGGSADQINLEILGQAAKQYDATAIELFTKAAEWVGLAISGLINFLNPDVIMIGGRVTKAAEDIFLKTLHNVARDNSFPYLFENTTFMTPKLGHLSSTIGAAAFVYQEEFRKTYLVAREI